MACPDAESIAELFSEECEPAARAAFADHAAACPSCHAVVEVLFDHTHSVESASSSADIPATIDRYVVRRKLGAGGMGVVYVAHDPELDREVAIKMLRRGVAAARLRREAKSLARLSHPNVVAVHDVGEHDGQVFVAMALVDGVDLRRWLKAQRTPREIVDVLIAAGRGIVAAHTAGLIHRDLKPDNIFISTSGDVLVGDFGLARDADDEADAIEGTPAYMPPEQADGRADERSDQYSFCVTAFEALHGKRPFVGATLEEIHASARAGRFAEARPIDARVDRALRRGLRANPDERFDSMADLLRELAPRSRRAMWLGAGAVLSVGAAITATWFATRTDPVATAEEQCASAGTPVWNALTRGAVDAAIRARKNSPQATNAVLVRLDEYASTWTTARRDLCLAQVARQITREQADAGVACLETRKTAFEVLARGMIETPQDIIVAWRRASTLPAPAACNSDDAAKLSSGTAEHQTLMRELAVAMTSDADGHALAAVAEKAARTTDIAARLEISLVQASDALEEKRTLQADAALEVARPLAEQLDVPSMRVRAFALTARSYCIQERYAEANHFLAMASAGARRLRVNAADDELDDVFLARTECMYHRRSENAALVPLLVERIEVIRRRYDRDSLEEAALHQRLGLVYNNLDRMEDGAREYEEGHRIYRLFLTTDVAAAVDADHASINALQAGDIDSAIVHGRKAIELFTALSDPEALRVLVALGPLLDAVQDRAGAIEIYSRVIASIPETELDETTRTTRIEAFANRGYDRVLTGQLDAAIEDLQVAIAGAEKLQRVDLRVEAQLSLGRAWLEKGEADRAVRILRDSVEKYAQQANASQWRAADSRFTYAQALWESGNRAAATTLAKEAETLVAATIAKVRGSPFSARFVPIAEARLAFIEHWRDTHR